MTDPDIWTIAALAFAALGIAAMIAGIWRPDLAGGGLGAWSRALLITAFAAAISGAAWRTVGPLPVWFSGFFVCAALHRWIDAVSQISNIKNLRVKGAEQ